MKKKLICIFICMLLIAISTTVVSSINTEKLKKNIQKTSFSVDVPVWEEGDTWVYNEYYAGFAYNNDGTLNFVFHCNYTNTYTVTNDTGDNYTIKATSKNKGGIFNTGSLRIKFTPFTKMTQEIELRKTDLAYVHFLFQEKGLVLLLIGKIGFPIPAHYNDVVESSHNPAFVYLPFPFTAGTNGTIPSYTVTGHEKMALYWFYKLVDSDYFFDFPALNYTCEMANITVPAGNYDAYNISTDVYFGSAHNYTRAYYVPEVGYYAKWTSRHDWNASGMPAQIQEFNLVSTTYEA